jgi:hypothetical protein
MGLILLEGCEDYSVWTASGAVIAAGRSGNCWHWVASTGQADFRFLSGNETDTVTVGFAWRATAFGTSVNTLRIKSDNGATDHVDLRINTDLSMSVLRGSVNLILGPTAANLLALNTWYYIEMQAKLHDTTGTVTVKVNGITVLTGTGLDTKNAGTKTVFDTVHFENQAGSTVIDIDDIYIESAAGDPFLGDIIIETLYPNGNGNANAWSGSDGDSVNNYLLVDEVPPNTTDYVFSSTSGQQDMYTMQDMVHSTGTVVGVCHTAYATRTDAVTPRQIKLVNRRTTDSKSPAIDLTTAYLGYAYAYALDPETSAAWTITNVNALQSGVELV